MNISGFQSSYCCCCKLSKYLYKLYFYALAILFNLKIIWFNAPWIDDVIPVMVWNIRFLFFFHSFCRCVDISFCNESFMALCLRPKLKSWRRIKAASLMQPPEGFTFKLNRGLFQSEKIKINLVSPKKIAHEVKSGEIKACSPPVWQKNNNK